MRFERQAKARSGATDNTSDADAGQIVPVLLAEQPGSATTELGTKQDELFTDNFHDYVLDVFIELKEGLLTVQTRGSLNEELSVAAVEELADLDNEAEAVNVLTEVLQKDENSYVREAALESITDFEDPGFQRRAARLSIHDSEQDIRMRTGDIFADIEEQDILRGIVQAHNDREIRAFANDAIEDEQ